MDHLEKLEIEKLRGEVKFWQQIAIDQNKVITRGREALTFDRMFDIGLAMADLRHRRRLAGEPVG